jgi:hypothetical protein
VAFTITICVLVVFLFAMIVWMSKPSQPRLRFGESPRDHAAEADIEDHDIDEMIEARNERRRRLGRPDLADDLAEEIKRELWR